MPNLATKKADDIIIIITWFWFDELLHLCPPEEVDQVLVKAEVLPWTDTLCHSVPNGGVCWMHRSKWTLFCLVGQPLRCIINTVQPTKLEKREGDICPVRGITREEQWVSINLSYVKLLCPSLSHIGRSSSDHDRNHLATIVIRWKKCTMPYLATRNKTIVIERPLRD